ncbi:MAG TPA: putative sulfate exporter family transporter, partial [Bryobacteraceae bacterium]|nr:putative sulfate exporter family transporter [Bryobacteraceae bacterium]
QTQFGLWAAVAIHDTSSVVGAAMRYGTDATAIATAVKLVRAMWILPVAVITALAFQAKRKLDIPWFIACFVAATWVRSAWPAGKPVWDGCATLAKPMLSMTLFLIGASLSLGALRSIGWRVLAMALVLWSVIASVTLELIRASVIHL